MWGGGELQEQKQKAELAFSLWHEGGSWASLGRSPEHHHIPPVREPWTTWSPLYTRTSDSGGATNLSEVFHRRLKL